MNTMNNLRKRLEKLEEARAQRVPKLSPADAKLLAAFVAGKTYKQIARATGMSEADVASRLHDPGFRLHLLQHVLDIVTAALPVAFARLSELAAESKDKRIALEAARAILQYGHAFQTRKPPRP